MKQKDKEKEQAEKLKALRRELEEKMEEQLSDTLTLDPQTQVEVQRLDEIQTLEPAQRKKIIEALLFALRNRLPLQKSGRPSKASASRKLRP